MDRFFIHGLGHYLGMEVHDVGDIGKPIQPGEVFTIEPGLYIESESIGIRIEDDYLVTETGLEKLSSAIPSEPDAVEKAIAAAQAKRAAAQPKP
jgi:Xaa-Pro aminopeptidase